MSVRYPTKLTTCEPYDARCWRPTLQLEQRLKPRAKTLDAKKGRGSRRRRSVSISLAESNGRAP